MHKIGSRISELMEALNLDGQKFAETTGIAASKISSYVNGRYKPGLQAIDAIVVKCRNLNARWLISGEGPMFMDENMTAEEKKEGYTLLKKQKDDKNEFEKPPDKEDTTSMTSEQIISKLVLQNDKLINIIDRHSLTIENLSISIKKENCKEKPVEKGHKLKNVPG